MILLFALLWGSLLTLFLCGPFSYYPLFLITLSISIGVLIISRKICLTKKFWLYPMSLIVFLSSYYMCSYTIFKSKHPQYAYVGETSSNREAVIFYCEGEMEKYTPYYADYFFEETPFILKPLSAIKLKNDYLKLRVNTKNSALLEIAAKVKASLLNYKPYFFYVCFAGYSPDISDSINAAIQDGCQNITIINYTAAPNLEERVYRHYPISSLRNKNVSINFTPSVCSSASFIENYTYKLKNVYDKYDRILILDNKSLTGDAIKKAIENTDDNKVLVTTNLENSLKLWNERDLKHILIVNTNDSSSGYNSKIIIPDILNKYSRGMDITFLGDWGKDKYLVKATIDVFLETSKEKNKE